MWHIQKRHASGGGGHSHPPAPHPFVTKIDELPPVSKENEGRTGYGEIKGELRNIMGGPLEELDTFPAEMGKLERGRWFPWSLRDDYPPFITTSAEQNQRIWTEMQMEQLLDHHPPHEVHASELPDYHYFPSITNELDPKVSPEIINGVNERYSRDQTDVPRFFRTGIPKTPRHEQDWYIPLLQDGRFDWKRNIRQNGYTASMFDKTGWDRRFFLKVNTVNPPMHITGIRQLCQNPIFFRVAEAPLTKRIGRNFYGSQFDKHVIFISLYFGALIYLTSQGGHWRKLCWTNDPYNVDICFASENRNKGGFHGVI